MPVIDGNTGKLRDDLDRTAVLQVVKDRVLTRLGERKFRPEYGSYVRFRSLDDTETRSSVFTALEGYRHADKIRLLIKNGLLEVTILND